jgi:uncharacterized repeat protein (TIGR04076 family)
MFKVKVSVAAVRGDPEKYPCGFGHKVGDEVIFDGETITGKICPDCMPLIIPHVFHMMYAGPRYHSAYYYAAWKYQGARKKDPSMKKYDGFGWKPVIEGYDESPYHMRIGSIQWSVPGMGPLATTRVDLPVRVHCPDDATMVTFDIAPFGLTDSGQRHLPFYRREMSIVDKIKAKPGIEVSKVLDEFSEREIKEIYPVLCRPLFEELLEELELAGYVETRDGKAYPVKDLPPR